MKTIILLIALCTISCAHSNAQISKATPRNIAEAGTEGFCIYLNKQSVPIVKVDKYGSILELYSTGELTKFRVQLEGTLQSRGFNNAKVLINKSLKDGFSINWDNGQNKGYTAQERITQAINDSDEYNIVCGENRGKDYY